MEKLYYREKYLKKLRGFYDDVLSNREMTERWEVYSESNPYASGISFKEIVDAVKVLSEICVES